MTTTRSLLVVAAFMMVAGTVRSAGAQARQERSTADIVLQALPSVFPLFLGDQSMSQGEAHGTAFVVDEGGVFVTNRHVVEDLKGPLFIRGLDWSIVHVHLLGYDDKVDVALLQASKTDHSAFTPIDLAKRRPKVGDVLAIVGYPSGASGYTACTLVGRDEALITKQGTVLRHALQCDSSLAAGSSGGVWLNSKGQAVGVNAAHDTATSEGFAVSADAVLSALASMRRWNEVLERTLGITAHPSTTTRASGVAGSRIDHIEPGSPAALAGLRPSDTILMMEGLSMVNAGGERLPETFERQRVGLLIERDGQRLLTRALLNDGSIVRIDQTARTRPEASNEQLATCLRKGHATLRVRSAGEMSREQLRALPEAISSSINIVICEDRPDDRICHDYATPSWSKFARQILTGSRSLEELAQMFDCQE